MMDDKQRLERFNQIKENLESEGYSAKVCTISVLKANVMAFVLAGPLAIVCWLIFCIVRQPTEVEFGGTGSLLFFLVFLISIFIHEALHGLTWGLFCKNGFKSIKLGMMWKVLTPYCACAEPLNFTQYFLGALMPFFVLGLGAFFVALATKSIACLAFSMLSMLAAGGDITIVCMLLKYRKAKALFADHPTECGFYAFVKEEKELSDEV